MWREKICSGVSWRQICATACCTNFVGTQCCADGQAYRFEERLWYAERSAENGWSRSVLVQQVLAWERGGVV